MRVPIVTRIGNDKLAGRRYRFPASLSQGVLLQVPLTTTPGFSAEAATNLRQVNISTIHRTYGDELKAMRLHP